MAGMITRVTALFFICCLLCCCRQDVQIESKQIDFSLFGSFDAIRQGEILDKGFPFSEDEAKPFRLIHFDGPASCSTCLLKQYYLWDELISHLGEDKIKYYFLLEPRKEYTTGILAETLDEGYFSRPVFLDREGVFASENGLSTRTGSGDILTDQKGTVLFVGDLRNDLHAYSYIRRKISGSFAN
ncbi:MAG: hypothetical protein IJU34_09520 [Bacteroidales bacterium]|nr:hypothetical protein [Bacteroidales bacterium]